MNEEQPPLDVQALLTPPPETHEQMLAVAHNIFEAKFSRKYAKKKMTEAGCPDALVEAAIEQAWTEYMKAQRTSGLVMAVVGAVMCGAGSYITYVSVEAAQKQADAGGQGTYVALTGCIIVGAWMLFRGTLRALTGR